ncbi:USP16_45 [Mytilus coruscus]|uniref:USP16_45 n=1 Tax=Mytilus coruscus TaxID=42192 RepID=A0A6J8E7V2_MYTCO|nr:USP16_45 [Mytilus coruscus]
MISGTCSVKTNRKQLLETKPSYSMRKNKKHKIRKTKDASDSSDDGSGPTCNHVNMSVNFVQMKKGLSTQTFGECLSCNKESIGSRRGDRSCDGMAASALTTTESILQGEIEPTIWVCLHCGHQGCDRNSYENHALKHYETPRSSSHCMVVNTSTWSTWCYKCDDGFPIEKNKKVQECIDHLRKLSGLPLEQSSLPRKQFCLPREQSGLPREPFSLHCTQSSLPREPSGLPLVESDSMDNSTNILCGICDAQHITKTANFWCTDCDDGLCIECNSHHSFSKASRLHGVISIEDYRKLSTDISNIVHHCIEHEKKLQIFCPHHDQLCCHLCLSTSHKDCTGMLPIEEMAKTCKSSGLMKSLQKSLEDLKNSIDRVVQDRQTNITKIKEQRQNIDACIKQLRERINSHFDKLEQEIMKELNISEYDLKTKIEDLLKELQDKSERIAVLQNNISDLKNHASDLQTLIGSKTLEKKIESEETYVQSLLDDERLKQLSLKSIHNERIENLLQNITSFGSLSMESSPPTVEIKLEKIKQAQIMSASLIPKSVDIVQATFLGKFQIPKGISTGYNITGCAIFPNGKIIFADCDTNKRLLIFNTDASLDCEVPLSDLRPFDVACIDDTTIAFSVWDSSDIHIFDIKLNMIKNKIKANYPCFGIALKDVMMYYCTETSVAVVNIKDGNSSTIVKLDSSKDGWRYIASFGESVYFTDRYNNSVSCFSVQGEKLWDFKDEIRKGTSGRAIDKHGIVYVAFKEKHSVVAISPDGKRVVDVLGFKDGIEMPYKLFYDNERDLLLVAGYSGNCALFEIK